jgi:hypothetical protein
LKGALLRLIVGRDYSPALWARVLGFLKLCEGLDPNELPRQTLRRPWHSPQRHPVTETVLQAPSTGGGATGVLNSLGITNSEIACVDLVLDIQGLLAQGKSNQEIIDALDLRFPDSGELIDHFRKRYEDLL